MMGKTKKDLVSAIDSIAIDSSTTDLVSTDSVPTIETATAVLVEFMDRYKISHNTEQMERLCKDFSRMPKEEMNFADRSDKGLEEILFGLLTDGIDLESLKKSGSERTPNEIIDYMLDMVGYKGKDILNKVIIDPSCGTGTFVAGIVDRFVDVLAKNANNANQENIRENIGENIRENIQKNIGENIQKNIQDNIEVEENIEEDIQIEENIRTSIHKKILEEKVIRAYDTNPSSVYVTKVVLVSVLIRKKIIVDINEIMDFLQNLPIYCDDFLKVKEKVDYVVGNPPYIRVQNLPNEYRDFMKQNFVSATGRFDIYTCFIEVADKLLKDKGRMCLITSNKYLTANYGVGIRKYLAESGHVRKIVDLFDTKFFGAAVLPAIIMCENSADSHSAVAHSDVAYVGIKESNGKGECQCKNASSLFDYVEHIMKGHKSIVSFGEQEIPFEIVKSIVKIPSGGQTWNFSSASENQIKAKLEEKQYCKLGDILEVCVGIKTTADKVFVKPMTEQFVKQKKFEKEVIYPLVQSFNVEKWKITWGNSAKDRYILYPHREENGNMIAIPLEEIPHAKKYIKENKAVLRKRKYLLESKTREWYECWVPQKLSKFKQPKLVTRDIVSHNSFAYDDSGKLCQGNTFFLTRRQAAFDMEYSSMTEEEYYLFVLGMLNAKVMEYYQKMISGCLYSQKYRYTTTNLNRWPIPKIKLEQAMLISKSVKSLLNGEEEREKVERLIDDIMYTQFELTDEEINEIEKFVAEK